jgi:hypothetical protein
VLGEIARVAARIVTAAIRTLTGERDLVVGIVACLQTHGARANWHPHLHLLVTDGGFPTDGTFVSWPVHETARVTEAFRRAVRRLFVRLALLDEDQAAGMMTWPHAGFPVHTAVWVSEDDRAFATRLARDSLRTRAAREAHAGPRSPDRPVSAAPAVTPREHAGTLGGRAVPPHRHRWHCRPRSTRPTRRPNGPRGPTERGRARGRGRGRGRRSGRMLHESSTDPD